MVSFLPVGNFLKEIENKAAKNEMERNGKRSDFKPSLLEGNLIFSES